MGEVVDALGQAPGPAAAGLLGAEKPTPQLRRLAAGTRRDPVVERVLFALVANRALAPSSNRENRALAT